MRRRSRSSAIKEMCIRTAIRHQGPPRRLAKLKHAQSAGGRGGAADAAGQTPRDRRGPRWPALRRAPARAVGWASAADRREHTHRGIYEMFWTVRPSAQRGAQSADRRSPGVRRKEGRRRGCAGAAGTRGLRPCTRGCRDPSALFRQPHSPASRPALGEAAPHAASAPRPHRQPRRRPQLGLSRPAGPLPACCLRVVFLGSV